MKLTNKKAKIYGTILGIVLFALLAVGITYALLTWISPSSKISIVTECMNANYTKGEDVVSGELLLFNEKDIINSGKITVKNGMALTNMSFSKDTNCNLDVVLSLNLHINNLPDGYIGNSSGALKYVVAEYNPQTHPNVSVSNLENNSFSIVKKGTIESTNDVEIYAETLPSDGTSRNFLLIFYVDGNIAKNEVADDSFNVTLEAIAIQSVNAPLSDFTYSIDSYDMYGDGGTIIEVEEGEILLGRYEGTSSVVNIPATYKVDGVEYNTVILSDSCGDNGTFTFNEYIKEVNFGEGVLFKDFDCDTLIPNAMYYLFGDCTSLLKVTGIPDTIESMNYTFGGCTSLVNAPEIPNSVISMENTFYNCTSLMNAPVIPDSVENMWGTFESCTSLEDAPVIPESVTEINYTFENCSSLVNAPEIPNSVISMDHTFYNCTSLMNAPVIPDSVENMWETFHGCTSLTTAPEIPSSVTKLESTFQGCDNLTGTIRINSSSINSFNNPSYHPFYDTGKSITVEVPAGSNTYTILNAYKPANVTITTY